MTNLQHELESLKRRQSDLEDQELELMERLEVAEKALAAAQQGLEKARADRERAEQLRDDALADIADGTTRHEAARDEVAAGISAPLLTLYDRIRTQTGSTGAAMLKARRARAAGSSCTATSWPPCATPTRTRWCAARTAAGSWCAPPSPAEDCRAPARGA